MRHRRRRPGRHDAGLSARPRRHRRAWCWRSTPISCAISAATPSIPRRSRSCTSSAFSTSSSSARIRSCASSPAQIGDERVIIADFSHLPTHCRFIALMPQWDFLDFLAEQARRYPSFHLRMQARVTDLIMEHGRVLGLRAETPEGPLEVRADLVVGADGRHSDVRDARRAEGRGFRRADGRALVPPLQAPERRRADARPHPGRRGVRHARPRRLLAMRLCHPERRLRRAAQQGARRVPRGHRRRSIPTSPTACRRSPPGTT